VNLKHYLRSLFYRCVICRSVLVESRIHKFHLWERFHNERDNNFDRVFSESFPHANSLSSEEWHETHGIMLGTAFESLRFKLVMVFTPLVFKMVKFVNVGHHHVISLDLHTSDVAILSYTEASAQLNRGIDSQSLINYILKVIILAQVQALNRQFLR